MADLNELQSSGSTKLVGASTSGSEADYINSFNAQLQSADLLNGSASQTTLVIGTTAVECKVGGSNLTNRKLLIIQPHASNYTFGFTSGSQPFTVANGATLFLSLGPNISVWVRRTSGSGNVSVCEVS